MGISGSGTRCRVDVSILTTGYRAQCRSCISLTESVHSGPPKMSGVSYDVIKPVAS
jgi:hypothetical protein